MRFVNIADFLISEQPMNMMSISHLVNVLIAIPLIGTKNIRGQQDTILYPPTEAINQGKFPLNHVEDKS